MQRHRDSKANIKLLFRDLIFGFIGLQFIIQRTRTFYYKYMYLIKKKKNNKQ